MKIGSRFFKDIRRLDKSAFNLTVGLRAAAFVIVPIIIGFAIQQPALLFASLGTVFLTFTERFIPTMPSRMLLLVCCTEAAAFGVGTLTATTGHLLSPLLLGIGVFVALFAWSYTKWAAVGMFTAIVFAVGVGLPGYSIQSAGLRTFFSLIGTLWAMLGIEIHRFVMSHRIQLSGPASTVAAIGEKQSMPRLEALRSALIIGIASALGYTIGLVLGLPRDFWIVITIILAIRPNPNLTITFVSMMVMGTIAGSIIAAVITLETSNHYLLLALLFSFVAVLLAVIGVNVILIQIFLVPFIIILLSIYYPGQWYISLFRILDVAIGGAIAVAMVYLKGLKYFSRIRS
ncbi:MAG: FUSC family protein [Candidatus Nitrosopolaris sp.]